MSPMQGKSPSLTKLTHVERERALGMLQANVTPSVDNHIPRDDIFDYHPIRECNIYVIYAG